MNIIESNGIFKIASITGVHKQLPAGNYLLKFDPREGYYLTKKPDFKLPSKIYGDHSITKRWLRSYKNNSEKNMGIVLSGIKGSGKTITAQLLCIESEMPVIIINELFHGADFIDFISQWDEVIIFIDEFEKIYRQELAFDMLSLMDGNYQTRMIFLLTINESNLNYYLINRLNRVKYKKEYIDLEEDIVEEVIEDLLIKKEHKESIYKFFKKVNMCTFDLLVNIIKEMNLFEEDAIQCGCHLNLTSETKTYEVWEFMDGKQVLQTTINLRGDAEEFLFERNILSKEYIDLCEKLDEKDHFEDTEFWYVKVSLPECKITNLPGGGEILIENPKLRVPLKIRLKKQSHYQFIL